MLLHPGSRGLISFSYAALTVSVVILFSHDSEQSSTSNRGNITLLNSCDFPLYIEGVARTVYLNTTVLLPNSQISHPFRITTNGTGNSLKVSTREGSSEITQIEYSACFENPERIPCCPPNQIFYDLSKINGTSQTEYGIRITPSHPECIAIDCPSGVQECDLVYYSPHDDYATKACDVRADLDVEFHTR